MPRTAGSAQCADGPRLAGPRQLAVEWGGHQLGCPPDLRCSGRPGDAPRGAALVQGWELLGQPATKSTSAHTRGGVAIIAILHPGAENASHRHQYQHGGGGFGAAALKRGRYELTVVSLYLGVSGPTNSHVLAELISYMRNVREPWIVGGDFNIPPDEFMGTNVVQVMRGAVLCTGEPTCNIGTELDYVVVSRCLEGRSNLQLAQRSKRGAVPPNRASQRGLVAAGARWRPCMALGTVPQVRGGLCQSVRPGQLVVAYSQRPGRLRL